MLVREDMRSILLAWFLALFWSGGLDSSRDIETLMARFDAVVRNFNTDSMVESRTISSAFCVASCSRESRRNSPLPLVLQECDQEVNQATTDVCPLVMALSCHAEPFSESDYPSTDSSDVCTDLRVIDTSPLHITRIHASTTTSFVSKDALCDSTFSHMVPEIGISYTTTTTNQSPPEYPPPVMAYLQGVR